PVFAAGLLASRGHTDLAGSLLPSTRIKMIAEMDVNVLSLKGGGVIWNRPYICQITKLYVSDNQINEGFWPSNQDGQELARQRWTSVVDLTFKTMAFDPDLASLPRLAQTAWLDRLLARDRVDPRVKRLWVEKVTADLTPPAKTIKNSGEETEILDEAGTANIINFPTGPPSVFESANQVLLKAAGQLAEIKMTRPLTPEEKTLENTLIAKLGVWSRFRITNRILRQAILSDHRSIFEKKVAVSILAGDLETLDNDDFIRQLLAKYSKDIEDRTSRDLEAAVVFLAAKGENAPTTNHIPRSLIVQAFSGDDRWAAPLIVSAIKGGDFGPEVLRLVGAMRLEAVLPDLLSALETATAKPEKPGQITPPRIPLLPATTPTTKFESGPDPVLIARTLANFMDNPQVTAALRNIIKRRPMENFISEELAAEAVQGLGRWTDRSAPEVLYDQWLAQTKPPESPLIRQAALTALINVAGPDIWAKVETKARTWPNFPPEKAGALIEVMNAFGRVRYQPAGAWLVQMAGNPNNHISLRQAAITALSRLATSREKTALQSLAKNKEPALARESEKALEKLAMEMAFWQELDRK
ncbi:MAG: hypothetical protein HQK55_17975, partial [Deltaproteobacteria bacterium]|nr:hypothetical protein [Deltaproteobacteria bacterium]